MTARAHRRRRDQRATYRSDPRTDRYSAMDCLEQAIRAIGSRPARSLLAIAATVLGIAALVTTVGLSSTGRQQVSGQFDLSTTQQLIVASAKDPGDPHRELAPLPWDAPERLSRLNGVDAAGAVSEVDAGTGRVTAHPIHDPSAAPAKDPEVYAITEGTLRSLAGNLAMGTTFSSFHEQRAERVAVVGERAAARLGIQRIDSRPAVFIDSVGYTVIGILGSVEREPQLLDAVMIPTTTARGQHGLGRLGEVHVRIVTGVGGQVADQAAIALSPDGAARYEFRVPPATNDLHDKLIGSLNAFFALLGIVALSLGTLAIAIVTTLSVLERRGEIGLRRALGGTGNQIAGQLLTETAILGLLGGLLGASIGTIAVLALSRANGWQAVLDLWVPVGAAGIGIATGALAGLVPAVRAARIEPATALQGGV